METHAPTSATSGMAGGAGNIAQTIRRLRATVPGFMEEDELELLRDLATRSRGTIVELGAAYGLSTIALCLGARESSAEVVTVDAFASMAHGHATDEARLPVEMEPLSKDLLEKNLATFGVSARVVNTLSWEGALHVEGPIGMLYVDADHSGDAVRRDLEAWVPKLGPDAIVAFHDYGQDIWDGVAEVADTWASRSGWFRGERTGFLQVFYSTQPEVGDAAQLVESEALSTIEKPSDGITELVERYVEAFHKNDLKACLDFYSDNAAVAFMTTRLTGLEAVARWHRQRFAAQVQVRSLEGLQSSGDIVYVDAVVDSRRLRRWRVKIRGRAALRLEAGKIKELALVSGRLIR